MAEQRMSIPSPRDVFDDPAAHWAFLTLPRDDDFEGQHFDRKEAGRPSPDGTTLPKQLQRVRDEIKQTISAFANRNVEGGLLVLGISSDGAIVGIDHLSETQRNSLTDFATLLHHQAAEAKLHQCADHEGTSRTICLIFVPYTENGICETPGGNPRAWSRNGVQNVPLTQDMRDRIRATKNIVNFDNAYCCPLNKDDLAADVLAEFRKVFNPSSTADFSDEKLLYEAGAIVKRSNEYWFTNAGLLFFASNPQRVLPRSHIRLLRFSVPSSQFAARGLPTFEQEFTGPLTKQIRAARAFFRESAFLNIYLTPAAKFCIC